MVNDGNGGKILQIAAMALPSLKTYGSQMTEQASYHIARIRGLSR